MDWNTMTKLNTFPVSKIIEAQPLQQLLQKHSMQYLYYTFKMVPTDLRISSIGKIVYLLNKL